MNARRQLFDRIETYSTEALRRQAGHTLSLQRLHQELVNELGAAAGTYHQLHQRLKQTRNVFFVMERPGPLAQAAHWPREIRDQYAGAIREAGVDLSPLVSLVRPEEPTDSGVVGLLEETLAALRARADQDGAMAADVGAVLSDLPELLEALRTAPPTTTPPRSPPAEW